MTDQQTIEDLRRTFDATGAGHHLKPGLGAAAWSAAHGSRPRKRLVPAIAGSVLATAAVAGGLVVWGTHHDGRTQTGGGSACAGSMTNTPLPVWARGGFSPAGIRTPHVIGKD